MINLDGRNKETSSPQKNSINLQTGEILFGNFNGYFSTTEFKEPTLKNINVHFKKGLFYGIAGKVGSGKSAILSAILEEVPYYSGELLLSGTLAYVEQEPYIFAGTIRENIVFGKPYDEEFYNQVIKVCCLESDFKLFPTGDRTEVGERGITVSGGQKARLSLARAVYSKADIYLFDDPISAVDAKVARRIYHDVIQGVLKNKTVLLVTHQVHYLTECDQLIIMKDGNIEHQGTPM